MSIYQSQDTVFAIRKDGDTLVGIPRGAASAGGVTQTLDKQQSAVITQDVNGTTVVSRRPLFQKYVSVVSFSGHRPPAFATLWDGDVVEVDCVAEDSVMGVVPEGSLPRPVVPGSVWYSRADGSKATGPADPLAVSTYFRPRLKMVVTKVGGGRNGEWSAETSHTLELLEESSEYP